MKPGRGVPAFLLERDMGRDGDEEQITSRPYGRLQTVKSKRVRFRLARQELFLEHLAATCNVARSAAAAGVTPQCVYQCRIRDAAFRAAWGVALEQGYARLEAALIARAMAGEGRTEIAGDKEVDGPEAPERIDWAKGMELLKHQQRKLDGRPVDNRARPARAPIEQVAKTLIRKLRVLGVEPERGDDGPSEAPRSGSG